MIAKMFFLEQEAFQTVFSFTFSLYKLPKYTKSHVPTALWNTVKNYPNNLSLAESGTVGQNKKKRKPHMADNFPGATQTLNKFK